MKLPLLIASVMLLTGCATPQRTVILVGSLEYIPRDIKSGPIIFNTTGKDYVYCPSWKYCSKITECQ